MISKRLTKTQKNQILEGYRLGETTNNLAVKFNCSSNTINRTVKNMLSNEEYKIVKDKRLKINKTKTDSFSDRKINKEHVDLEISLNQINKSEIENLSKSEKDLIDNNIARIKLSSFDDQKFEEIAPLESSFDFDIDKRKIDLKSLDNECLPESVYMIVDKKVELDSQPISDMPEWSFLPEDELKREAILLFANQRSAKRSCARNQRVIKIPNSKIFQTTKTFLISKGITRLIIDDCLISLID